MENLTGTDDFEDQSIDRRIILELIKIGYYSVDCIHLAKGKDKWRTLVSALMKLWVP
jgi:hypothetical protein